MGPNKEQAARFGKVSITTVGKNVGERENVSSLCTVHYRMVRFCTHSPDLRSVDHERLCIIVSIHVTATPLPVPAVCNRFVLLQLFKIKMPLADWLSLPACCKGSRFSAFARETDKIDKTAP